MTKTLISRLSPTIAEIVTLEQAKLHLRVDHTEDDELIVQLVSAAAAEIEDFASLALLAQTIRVTIFDHNFHSMSYPLPIGPVLEGATATILIDGAAFTDFTIEPGLRPCIRWGDSVLFAYPTRIQISYPAGFGSTGLSVPADLRLALLDQARAIYDNRGGADESSRSSAFIRIGARYRGVRG